jgi:hypothetical protein
MSFLIPLLDRACFTFLSYISFERKSLLLAYCSYTGVSLWYFHIYIHYTPNSFIFCIIFSYSPFHLGMVNLTEFNASCSYLYWMHINHIHSIFFTYFPPPRRAFLLVGPILCSCPSFLGVCSLVSGKFALLFFAYKYFAWWLYYYTCFSEILVWCEEWISSNYLGKHLYYFFNLSTGRSSYVSLWPHSLFGEDSGHPITYMFIVLYLLSLPLSFTTFIFSYMPHYSEISLNTVFRSKMFSLATGFS